MAPQLAAFPGDGTDRAALYLSSQPFEGDGIFTPSTIRDLKERKPQRSKWCACRVSVLTPLNQSSSAWAVFAQDNFVVGHCPVHRKMFSSIPGPYSLNAGSTLQKL